MKSFTLIEIVITIALLAIVLSMVTSMGRWFSDKVRFANTKEEFHVAVTNVIQESATTNNVYDWSGRVRYGQLELSWSSGSTISRTYSSGELVQELRKEQSITNGLIFSTGYTAVLTPYSIGCEVNWTTGVVLQSADNIRLQACYTIDAATCKLREIACN